MKKLITLVVVSVLFGGCGPSTTCRSHNGVREARSGNTDSPNHVWVVCNDGYIITSH